jgi:PEP-CTERM motif
MARSVCAAFALSLWLMFAAPFAHGSSVDLLNFIGLQNGQPVGNFYNGAGVASTPNYGVTFSSNVIGLRPSTSQSGAGGLVSDPTSTPYIYINSSTLPGIMNVAGGFSSGLNFFYASLSNETITVWSGINGTGTVLATMTLSSSCSGSPSNCAWFDTGLSFSGTAKSVTFLGPANGIGIADITLGQSTTAVPEPSSIYLLGIGLLGICAYKIRSLIRA